VAPPPGGPSYTTYLRSRPAAAEERAIERVLAEARATGARVHVLHLSSAGALAQLRVARADGVDATVETCPHYLALTAEAIDDGATQFKCAPPIRDHGNCERLWEALAGGEIDMIVSDHSPCTAELKRRDTGDFAAAWGGIASLELGLPVVWTAARSRGFGLAEVVRWMATAPADRVGLTYKGRIAVGADADLVVFDPEAEFVADPSNLQQRNPVSAYAGRRLAGVVRQTWLRGERVDSSSATRHGRLIERGRRE
jgi:allantoinase